MARVETKIVVPVGVDVAFAVSQTQGEVRYRWDPFVRSQVLLDGASEPDKGVRTRTRSRHGLTMVSEYTSFRRPNQVGMKMVRGPWFFDTFGGGWSFRPVDDQHTEATWRYVFTIRPRWLSRLAEPIGLRLLQRDIDRRIAGYARGCEDPAVLAAVAEVSSNNSPDI